MITQMRSFQSRAMAVLGSLFLVLGVMAQTTSDSNQIRKVYRFKIHDEIADPALHILKRAMEEAKAYDADLLFMELDTYGGRVDIADSMRTRLLRSAIPVFVLIDNNAASAGALISIACDSIYMTPGSTIGAATVVNQSGEQVPDKYQSYMRSKMRATAEETGRDPDIAEAMVDPDKEVPGISEKGKVLTFTVEDALKYGYCDGEANNMKEALKIAGIKDYTYKEFKPSDVDKVIGFLINPAISGILILIILGGIYFELQTPGVGFPIIAAAIAAVIFFAPYYIEGLTENWEILLFVAGIALLAVEIFVIPGFGVAGVSGILLVVTGLALSMVGNIGFDFTFVPPTQLFTSFMVVITASLLVLFGSILLLPRLFASGPLSKLVLQAEQTIVPGYISSTTNFSQLVGKTGVAYTDLRATGKVEVEGHLYDAYSIEGYIERNTLIDVIGYENTQLTVRSKS